MSNISIISPLKVRFIEGVTNDLTFPELLLYKGLQGWRDEEQQPTKIRERRNFKFQLSYHNF